MVLMLQIFNMRFRIIWELLSIIPSFLQPILFQRGINAKSGLDNVLSTECR